MKGTVFTTLSWTVYQWWEMGKPWTCHNQAAQGWTVSTGLNIEPSAQVHHQVQVMPSGPASVAPVPSELLELLNELRRTDSSLHMKRTSLVSFLTLVLEMMDLKGLFTGNVTMRRLVMSLKRAVSQSGQTNGGSLKSRGKSSAWVWIDCLGSVITLKPHWQWTHLFSIEARALGKQNRP